MLKRTQKIGVRDAACVEMTSLERLHPLMRALRWNIEGERAYLDRPEIRERLEGINHAAELLLRECQDLRLSRFIFDEYIIDTAPFLALQQFASNAREVLAKKPPRQGAGKHYPETSSGPNAHEYCALAAASLFKYQTNRWPGKKNNTVQNLCATMWKEACGEGNITPDTWRRYLQRAAAFRPPHEAGVIVSRLLKAEEASQKRKAFVPKADWYDASSQREGVRWKTAE